MADNSTDVDSAPDTTARITTYNYNVKPPTQELPQRDYDLVIDPKLAALGAMFPDYDDITLCVCVVDLAISATAMIPFPPFPQTG